ncbi:MAG: hypothetical protein JST22_09250, partial [Bacteroidetes bacterium]|nr:hypothetical protein [Bacteroidota bacterium]
MRSYFLVLTIMALALAPCVLHAQAPARDTAASSPLRGIGHGDAGIEGVPLSRFEYVEHRDTASWDWDGLKTADTFSLQHHQNTEPEFCTDRRLHSATFSIKLDRGDDYEYGRNAFAVSLSLNLFALDTNGDTTFRHNPVDFSINENAPEQLFQLDLASALELDTCARLDRWKAKVLSYSPGSTTQDVRLTFSYREEYAIGAKKTGAPNDPLVVADRVTGPVTGNPTTFAWEVAEGCNDTFPGYQLQVLRLFNVDTSYKSDSSVRAVVDWHQALTVETDDGRRSLALTLAEGTGYYLWRVRPIGSIFDGGVADSRNWGVWSSAPPQDTVLVFTNTADSALPVAAFYYNQFDDDINWVYSRTFTEGLRIGEGISYASPLGMPKQQQTKVQSADSIVAANSFQDYSGRPAAGSLAAPLGKRAGSSFGYRDTLVKHDSTLYGPQHFDEDTNRLAPLAANGGAVSRFWSNANGDLTRPVADNYPFARALYTTDGSGRGEVAGGPGQVYRIGGGSGGKERTGKAYYASASNWELVHLFGDEAPSDTSVIKVVSVDPNKVASVAWMTKEGTVIATAV